MSSKRTGSSHERALAATLHEMGFAVIRAPASGGGSTRELPDLFAGNGTRLLAIEAKYSSEAPIYLDEEELDDLTHFAAAFGADPFVSAKFATQYGDPAYGTDATGWYLLSPSELYRTDSGSGRVKKETALADGTPVETLGGDD